MIKDILDKIAAEPGTKAKVEILRGYQDNTSLIIVLYLSTSPRIKFYIKQIPEYQINTVSPFKNLDWAMENLREIYTREFTGGAAINHLQFILGSFLGTKISYRRPWVTYGAVLRVVDIYW